MIVPLGTKRVDTTPPRHAGSVWDPINLGPFGSIWWNLRFVGWDNPKDFCEFSASKWRKNDDSWWSKNRQPGQAMTPRDIDTHLEGTLFRIVFLHLSRKSSFKGMEMWDPRVFGKLLCQLQDMTVLACFSYQISTAKEQLDGTQLNNYDWFPQLLFKMPPVRFGETTKTSF